MARISARKFWQRVLEAIDTGRALRIVGGDSKAFYGGTCLAEQELNHGWT